MLPSSRFPFLNIFTDGRAKDRHNRLVYFVLDALVAAGVTEFNIAHIRDGGLRGDLPLVRLGRYYDIAFVDTEGEIVLVEIMRTYQKVSDGKDQG